MIAGGGPICQAADCNMCCAPKAGNSNDPNGQFHNHCGIKHRDLDVPEEKNDEGTDDPDQESQGGGDDEQQGERGQAAALAGRLRRRDQGGDDQIRRR